MKRQLLLGLCAATTAALMTGCATKQDSSAARARQEATEGAAGEDRPALGGALPWPAGSWLRLTLPGFPIRLDLAFPITNDDDTEEETFLFWINVD